MAKNVYILNIILNLVREWMKDRNDTSSGVDSWIFAGFTKNIMGQWRDASTDEMLEWNDNWSIGEYHKPFILLSV